MGCEIGMSKRCTYCGWPNDDDAEYCKGCGYELKKYWHYSKDRPRFVDNSKNK